MESVEEKDLKKIVTCLVGFGVGLMFLPSFRRSISLLVRMLKPFGFVGGIALVVGATVLSERSLLGIIADEIQTVKQKIDELHVDDLTRATLRNGLVLLENASVFVVFGVVIRSLYCILSFSLSDWKQLVVGSIFSWAKDNVPVIRSMVEKEGERIAREASASQKRQIDSTSTFCLPPTGRSDSAILADLQRCANLEDVDWKRGRISGTVYTNSSQHAKLMNSVYSLYCWSNPLHIGTWPKLNQCEAEVVSMTAHALHGPPIGTLTSGGTESIVLAIRAALRYYGHGRSIEHPEIICASSAHAGLDKACEVFGIRKVVIDSSQPPYQLDPIKVRNAMTSNTILIYASAPCYPQGVVDPIEKLSEVAQDFNVGLHVDACLGGFVLAFLDDEDAPSFDFCVPGVTSMSIDTHKYGYATKGTSVVIYRHKALRQSQYFAYPHWSGGIYITPTLAGSRPGGLSICAWAAMVSIGRDGYRVRAKSIVKTARAIASGVSRIPGIKLMTSTPYMVVCIGSDELDIYSIHDAMRSVGGWSLNTLQAPASIHFCVTLNAVGKENEFLEDLKQAVEIVRKEKELNGKKKQGTAGVYGMVGSVPAGPLEFVLGSYMDVAFDA